MRTTTVKMVTAVSFLALLLWVLGMGITLRDYWFPPTASNVKPPSKVTDEAEKKDGLRILALGDSLTRGTGDAEGKGYVGYLVDELKQQSDKQITLTNLGVNGLVSGQLVDLLAKKEVRRQIELADMILITIGGNDLFQGGQSLMEMDQDKINGLRSTYLKNLDQILSTLTTGNPEATIYLIGLYNPFIQLADSQTTSAIVREWNYQGAEVVGKYAKAVFVPTFDLFQLQVDKYLYTDQFHPNSEGYRLIADRVAGLITW